MDQSGSILLVSCYELGHQPLTLAWPAAFLQKAGYSSDFLDLAVDKFDESKVARARFVGISVPMHTALRLGVRAAEQIRRINPSCHICFYGLYASLNSDYLLRDLADAVIGGEFEAPLLALVTAIFENGATNTEIDGVSFRGVSRQPYLQRLAFVPPSYEGLAPLENYAHLIHDGTRRRAGYVEASRGCLHRCLHCPITPVYDGRFFVVPETVVIESVRDLVDAGATHITFGDPDFLNGPGHALRVIRAMHKEFPQLTFDFTAKVEHLLKHGSLVEEFAEAGCLFVTSAFESISEVVLQNLHKGHSRHDIDEVLKLFRNSGIALRPTWVPFTPWTSLDDFIEMLDYIYVQELVANVDPVQYTIRLLIPPGSSLLEQPEIETFLGSLDQPSFTYTWAHPDPRMDALQATVSVTVEQMNQAGESTFGIFKRVRELAYQSRGDEPRHIEQQSEHEPPRLSESWFCCAEPTGSQFEVVNKSSEQQIEQLVSLTRTQPSQIPHAEGFIK